MGRIQARRAEAAGERLTGIVGEMLAELRGGSAPRVLLDDDLERELGIDSLARVELVLRIERAFDVRLPEALLAEARTPRELLRALAGASPRIAPDLLHEAHAAAAPPEEIQEPRAAATLIEALDWHAVRHPQRVHITLLEADAQTETLTYGALAAEARITAAGLAARGISPGEAVAIMLPTGRAFFLAFTGALLAGAVPVPVYPPFRWTQIEEHLKRQARILANCAASLLITLADAKPVARLLQAQVPSLRHVADVADLVSQGGEGRPLEHNAGMTALIQYTSGSTGQPKGVVLTHANLLANIRAMGEAAQARSCDVFVS